MESPQNRSLGIERTHHLGTIMHGKRNRECRAEARGEGVGEANIDEVRIVDFLAAFRLALFLFYVADKHSVGVQPAIADRCLKARRWREHHLISKVKPVLARRHARPARDNATLR